MICHKPSLSPGSNSQGRIPLDNAVAWICSAATTRVAWAQVCKQDGTTPKDRETMARATRGKHGDQVGGVSWVSEAKMKGKASV